jgi:hypothetical protein
MVALMIINLVWSTLISAEVMGSVSGVRVHMPLQGKTVIDCAFASAHVLVGCASVGIFEMLVRAVLFYVLCSLVILCAPFAPPPDRSSPHANSFVLGPAVKTHTKLPENKKPLPPPTETALY